MTEALDRAVRTVLRDCLKVQIGEEVLIVCNPITEELASLMRIEAQGDGAEATMAVIAERDSHAGEPPAPVAAAMLACDVLIAPTIQSLSHTTARREASEVGVRVASLPGVNEEMLTRLMDVDMRALRRRGRAVCAALTGGEARITCANGSDLRLGLEGRTPIADAGVLGKRGAFGNLPCGEGFIAPVEGTGEGTLVVDGSIAGVGKLEEPVTLTVRDGHLTGASGEAGAMLVELLGAHGQDATNVAELGIGTNSEATLTGNVLEDEKILGSAHVAFGASASIGGTVQVPVHLDCVVLEPTVEVDGRLIAQAGQLHV